MSYTQNNEDVKNILGIFGEWIITALPHQQKLMQGKKKMNFNAAIDVIKDGGKVRREIWDGNMWMWWHKTTRNGYGCVLHSLPYFDKQESYEETGYPYVLENDDLLANDWIRVA